jgi:hypothetical protein
MFHILGMKTGIVIGKGFHYLDFLVSVAKVDKRNKCLLYVNAKHDTFIMHLQACPQMPRTV